jgi:hypothetical protein
MISADITLCNTKAVFLNTSAPEETIMDEAGKSVRKIRRTVHVSLLQPEKGGGGNRTRDSIVRETLLSGILSNRGSKPFLASLLNSLNSWGYAAILITFFGLPFFGGGNDQNVLAPLQ